MKSANGVLILILGILGFVGFGCLTGLPAWIMGRSSLKDIDAGVADPSERSLVQVGMILGMVTTIITILLACLWLAMVAGVLGLAAVGGAAGGPR
jgi:hypothetical protein